MQQATRKEKQSNAVTRAKAVKASKYNQSMSPLLPLLYTNVCSEKSVGFIQLFIFQLYMTSLTLTKKIG
jgi:hypothetical protein